MSETYPCKFAEDCSEFRLGNQSCLHGGGVSCKTWCWRIDLELFGVEGAKRLRNF